MKTAPKGPGFRRGAGVPRLSNYFPIRCGIIFAERVSFRSEMTEGATVFQTVVRNELFSGVLCFGAREELPRKSCAISDEFLEQHSGRKMRQQIFQKFSCAQRVLAGGCFREIARRCKSGF